MSDQINPSFQKARDEALRALISDAGLTPDQVSALKLSQVHLSTGTLVIEPDEFDPSTAVRERPFSVKLDAAVQRALIAWLVVRPDGPNDHLFPGKGAEGLDVEAINQVLAAKKPAKSPHAKDSVDAARPPRAEGKTPETLPESIPPSPRKAKPEKPAPPPPPVSPRREGTEADAVSLDEIESLRRRLADTYDAWGPAVTAAAMKSAAEPPQRADVPPRAPVEAEPLPDSLRPPLKDESEPVAAPEPVTEVVEPPPTRAEEELATKPKPEPPEELGAAPSPGSLGERLKGWWKSDEKVSFKLTNRTLVLGGLALLLVICCASLAVSGVMMLGSPGTSGLLAGATPTETPAPIETAPAATPTASPSPRPTVTSTSTQAPEATLTPAPATTDTPPALTSTPIVVVITATPTPEPPATETPVPTDTPEGGPSPEPTATPIPGFKYPAPVLLEPEDGATVPGVINYLKWEPVGPLADDEWYAVRLIFLQQGQPVYGGDWVKISEWLVPERFYYQADGPALEYRWFVFVERKNSDGTVTQLSPESETFVFRWE